MILLQEEETSSRSLKRGSCLVLRQELSEETHVLTQQETLLGRGAWAESNRIREARRNALPCASQTWVDGSWVNFQVVVGQSSWLRELPGGEGIAQPKWMPLRRTLGGGRTCGVSFWPFLNSSGWWWQVSSVFLTRTSCPKITHINGYCGDWPGWVVSVTVFPIRILQLQGSFFFKPIQHD